MAAKILTITNQKGGVGKTTCSYSLAVYLAEQGKSVLFMDFDAQGNSSGLFLDNIEDEYISSFRTKDLFANELSSEIEVTETEWGVDVIRSAKNDLDLFECYSLSIEDAINPNIHLQEAIEVYDYIVIDSPPSLGTTLLAALSMSTHVVCITELSGFAMDGMAGLLDTINLIQEEANPELNFIGILVNKFNSRSESHKTELKNMKSELGKLVLKSSINLRSSIDTAMVERVPVWHLPKKTGASRTAAKEMKVAFDEIIKIMGRRK